MNRFFISSSSLAILSKTSSHFFNRTSFFASPTSSPSSLSPSFWKRTTVITPITLTFTLTSTFRVQCFSSATAPAPAPKIFKKSKKKKKIDPSMEENKDKDAFYVVRKGDIVGVYKSLTDCQAQVGSSVCDPSVSVFKGYSLPKEAEDYLTSRGLKNAIYTINASDAKEDLFGELVPCPFQQPTSSNFTTSVKPSPPKRSQEVLEPASDSEFMDEDVEPIPALPISALSPNEGNDEQVHNENDSHVDHLVCDQTDLFANNQSFDDPEELITWCKNVGKSCGTVIITSRSDKKQRKKPRFTLSCDRSGLYRPGKRVATDPGSTSIPRPKRVGTKKCNCPFKLKLFQSEDLKWRLIVICGGHNHPVNNNLVGVTYPARPKLSEQDTVKEKFDVGVACTHNINSMVLFQETYGSTFPTDTLMRKHLKLDDSTKAQASHSKCVSCTIEFDGASKGNPGLSGAGAILRADDGSLVCRLREGVGIATNNVAEYRAVLLGMKHALRKGFTKIRVQGDSKLVCMQVQGNWKTKNENMAILCKEVKELVDKFLSFEIRHVLREFNAEADVQANLAINLGDGEVREIYD